MAQLKQGPKGGGLQRALDWEPGSGSTHRAAESPMKQVTGWLCRLERTGGTAACLSRARKGPAMGGR